MKGIVVSNDTETPQLTWSDVPDVEYAVDEVLVNIITSAVNRADLLQASGNYPPPPGASPLLGLEMAGEIAAVGQSVDGWKVGDRVCALLPGGGYAEQINVPAGMLMPLPDDWSFEMGAAVPEVWLTAFVNLFLEGNLQSGESALIHAAASGVGTAAIQLAKAIGAKAYATAGADHKLDFCQELGADLLVNRKSQDFQEEIQKISSSVDVVLCPVGADYLEKNLAVLGRLGRLVLIGLLSGAKSQINLGQVMGKRLKIVGSTLRSRPLDEKIAITQEFSQRFWPQLRNGTLRPIIDTTYPMQEAQAAHAHVRADKNIGKVILALQ
ncbi:MAG: NAD(P)H-quinone oxidoreductase [Chloroflexota bacterium]